MNATNPNAQLALELLERLAPIHGTSDVRERQRLVTVGGCAHLIPQIDWDGAALDYVAGLLGVLSADGQGTLGGYLAGLMRPGGLKLGPDDRPSLEALLARVAGLSTDEWAQAFPSGCFNDDRSTRTRLLHTLRAPVADFTGRADDVAALVAQFNQGGRGFEASATASTVVSIVVIRGMGGIGKTEVALKVAESLVDKYPDARLMFELQPGNIALTPEVLLSEVIRAFQPELRLPEDLAGLQRFYRATLAGKRGLLLLDNAANVAQVRPLLPLPAGWAALVTSRALFPLLGATLHNLDLLPMPDAKALLRLLLTKGGRNDLYGANLEPLGEVCGRLPLALHVAAGYLTSYPNRKLPDYVAALKQSRLGHLHVPDEKETESVEAVLAFSVTALCERNPTLADRWYDLAVFPAPFDTAAAVAVWAVSVKEADDALSRLVQQSLIEYNAAADTYGLHDLLSEVARGATLEDDIRLRHAEHYLSRGKEAEKSYLQGGAGVLSGLRAFDIAWPHLLAAWEALRQRTDEAALNWQSSFAQDMQNMLDMRLHPRSQLPFIEVALAAARRLGQREVECEHLGNLGLAYKNLGEFQQAIAYYEQRLAIAREIGKRHAEGTVLGNLGMVYSDLGEFGRAIEYCEQSLAIAREVDDQRGQAAALGKLGLTYTSLAEANRAIACQEQALAIDREIGDRRGESAALNGLGLVYESLGELRRAIEYYQQALTIRREIGDRRGARNTLSSLGGAYEALDELGRAIDCYEQSLVAAREIGTRSNEGVLLGHLGNAYFKFGEARAAIGCYEQALAISREIGDRRDEEIHLGNLGNAHRVLGEIQKAIGYYEQARVISQEIGDRGGEGVWLGNLGLAYAALDEVQKAIGYYEQALAISREIGDRINEGAWLGGLGNAYAALGEVARERQLWQEALRIFEAIESPHAATVRAWLDSAERPNGGN